ncbi:MAG: BrnT family toxin [Thermodesulfobacteriota bacterium]
MLPPGGGVPGPADHGVGAVRQEHARSEAALAGWGHGKSVGPVPAEGEQRFVTLGSNVFGLLRVVVWTHRGESIRVISVRKPTPRERRAL